MRTLSRSDRLQVVYVTGSSHSGSTLLALLGAQHPLVASVGEASVKPSIRREGRALSQRCSCGARVGDCEFWRRVFADVTRAGTRFDADCWSNDYRFEQPWLDRLLTRETSAVALRRARRWAGRRLPGYRRRVARIDGVNVAFIRAVLSQTGATVFLDTTKLVTRLVHLRDIEALDVKVVWLTRDVRGYAWSASRRGLPVERAARVWRHDQEIIRRTLRELPPDRATVIRYEDLCASPSRALDHLWRFCGVPPAALSSDRRPGALHVLGNSMRFAGAAHVALDERWKAGLANDDERMVLAIAGQMNQELGYC